MIEVFLGVLAVTGLIVTGLAVAACRPWLITGERPDR